MTPQPDQPASPDAVREMLKRQSGQSDSELDAPPKVRTSIELDAEAAEAVQGALGIQNAEKSYQAQEAPQIKVDGPSYASDKHDPMKFSELWDWMSSSDTIGEVHVTSEEQDKYALAVIEDGEFTLDCEINYGGHHTVVVRDLSIYERDLMAAALAEDRNKKLIVSPYEQLAHVQQYAIVMQIASINNLPFDHFKPEGKSLLDDMRILRERRASVMHSLRSAKVSMFLRAVMVFEAKMQMLHTAAANKTKRESFSDPRAGD